MMMNPKLKPLVKIKLDKLNKVGIIYPIRHSDWISNPIIVRKNTEEIYMCVNFIDLNKASIKYNFPLPTNKLLHRHACPCWMDFLDIIRSW